MVIRRGELWWADLPAPDGSAPGYRRPVLIVQSDLYNRTRLRTVLAVAITSNLLLSEAPGNVLIPRADSGLTRDSVANVTQTFVLDKERLTQRIGLLPRRTLLQVDAGLRLVLDL